MFDSTTSKLASALKKVRTGDSSGPQSTGDGRLDAAKVLNATLQLTEFAPFMSLPTELRLKIWELCIPGPRVIALHPSRKKGEVGLRIPTPVPVVLHISAESRAETMRSFVLFFGAGWFKKPRHVYINVQIDTVMCGGIASHSRISPPISMKPELRHILQLALSLTYWVYIMKPSSDRGLSGLVEFFPALRELTMITRLDGRARVKEKYEVVKFLGPGVLVDEAGSRGSRGAGHARAVFEQCFQFEKDRTPAWHPKLTFARLNTDNDGLGSEPWYVIS